MATVRSKTPSSARHDRRPVRPGLPRPLPLRPPHDAANQRGHPIHVSDCVRTIAPRQYRLELVGSITGPELDTFVASGFVENAGFRPDAAGGWRQTQLESDRADPQADDAL